jgi:hypothetical protein
MMGNVPAVEEKLPRLLEDQRLHQAAVVRLAHDVGSNDFTLDAEELELDRSGNSRQDPVRTAKLERLHRDRFEEADPYDPHDWADRVRQQF